MQQPICIDRALQDAHLHATPPLRLRLALHACDLSLDLLLTMYGNFKLLVQGSADAVRHHSRLIVQRGQPCPGLPHFRMGVLAKLPLLDHRCPRLRPLRHQLLHRAVIQHFGQRLDTGKAGAFPTLLRRDPICGRLSAKGIQLGKPRRGRAVRVGGPVASLYERA